MKKDSKRRKFGLGLFVVCVMVLISCTLYLTYAIINNLYSDDVKINDTTANYISFLFLLCFMAGRSSMFPSESCYIFVFVFNITDNTIYHLLFWCEF